MAACCRPSRTCTSDNQPLLAGTPGGASARWYEMARYLTSSHTIDTPANMALRADGTGEICRRRRRCGRPWRQKKSRCSVLQRSDSDAQVPGIVAPNFIGSDRGQLCRRIQVSKRRACHRAFSGGQHHCNAGLCHIWRAALRPWSARLMPLDTIIAIEKTVRSFNEFCRTCYQHGRIARMG